MSFQSRLDQLEQAVKAAPCPTCGASDEAINVLPIRQHGEPEPPPPPLNRGPCPTCGRVVKVITLRPIRLETPRDVAAEEDETL